jgi:predicted RNase H-like HicB family nuclease
MGVDSRTGRAEVKIPVVYEPSADGFSAYVPDLPGCVAAGGSLPETRELIGGAIEMHIAAMKEDGDVIPQRPSLVEVVEVGEVGG